jgi:hypothetical protein
MTEMVQFARTNPMPFPYITGTPAYRCSAHLTDGTYLPCVLLAPAESYTELAIRRFEETKKDARTPKMFGGKRFGPGMQYADIVKSFLTGSNRVTHYAVQRLEESPYAISPERLSEVRGETRMSWTQFTVEMTDGSEHFFGTTWSREFFSMPHGYTARDIAKIQPHPMLAQMPEGIIYRERPFFICYIDGLGAIQADPSR